MKFVKCSSNLFTKKNLFMNGLYFLGMEEPKENIFLYPFFPVSGKTLTFLIVFFLIRCRNRENAFNKKEACKANFKLICIDKDVFQNPFGANPKLKKTGDGNIFSYAKFL